MAAPGAVVVVSPAAVVVVAAGAVVVVAGGAVVVVVGAVVVVVDGANWPGRAPSPALRPAAPACRPRPRRRRTVVVVVPSPSAVVVVVAPSLAVVVVVVAGPRGGRGVGVGRHGQHGAELELGGAAHDLLGLGAVGHAGELHDDGAALADDLGLGHAEAVDALADDVLGLLDALLRRELAVDLAGLEDDGEAALQVEAQGGRGVGDSWATMTAPNEASDGEDQRDPAGCGGAHDGSPSVVRPVRSSAALGDLVIRCPRRHPVRHRSSRLSSSRLAIASRAIVSTTPSATSMRTVARRTSTSVPWMPLNDSTRSPGTNDATSASVVLLALLLGSDDQHPEDRDQDDREDQRRATKGPFRYGKKPREP